MKHYQHEALTAALGWLENQEHLHGLTAAGRKKYRADVARIRRALREPKTQSARFHRLFETLSSALADTVRNRGECLMACHMLAGLCLSAAMNATGQDIAASVQLVSDAVNRNAATRN